MDLYQKIRTLPTSPGCYLYKNAEGEVIYVGKAKNLRARVRSYFLQASQANAKTGTLMREAVDVDYITVANEHEALALENNLIKQRKPRFNILLRDDKTYPYIKLTLADRYPKVFVTRRLRRDGSAYFGPYFPGNLAHRLVDLIHRSFLIPSCKVDLSRYHPRACLQYYIKRCLGPCVEGLTTPEDYRQAIRDVQLFLEGRPGELEQRLTARMTAAAENEQYELAARLRDQITTVHQMQDKQRIASAENEDADVFGFHFENEMLAVNLFHMRSGKIVDRRDFFWEDLPDFAAFAIEEDVTEALLIDSSEGVTLEVSSRAERSEVEGSAVSSLAAATTTDPTLEPNPTTPAPEIHDDSPIAEEHSPITDPVSHLTTNNQPLTTAFNPAAFFSALLKQLYLDQGYVPRSILVPVDFPDRTTLAELLAQRTGHRVDIAVPQRGEKRSLVDLVCQNAKQSYDQRFRVLIPSQKAIAQALQDALTLEELPRRIECFDISHIQGAETVASMVVWEDGAMKKSDYRKFQVRTVTGVDDFASMHEVVRRRYSRLLDDKKPLPSLILIDGGLGQLHAAADALNELGITTQPLASIAKREEIIYVYGQEDDPIVLDRRSPVLHLVQKIRDESHRFAISYHRKRREMRDRSSELLEIPGVGLRTRQRLLEHFGSIRAIRQTAEKNPDALTAVVNKATADRIRQHFAADQNTPANPTLTILN
ncbi:excinuclease ABC subunit UvrC [Edaphobacter aggregans]|uniref:excinuclease ABC subunit UvrC n=1 Tax=Edaphobacter aggregans TaxID=570835 RepID=UPI00054F20CD|nr:excinuclease ABC subunit UvrC [Edaphobacter aggregans]